MCRKLLSFLLPTRHCVLGKVRQSSVCLQTAGTGENNRMLVDLLRV